MAEIFVDEGLDAVLAVFPKNGTNYANLYMGLFTSQTATTVPARTATGGAVPSGWTEARADPPGERDDLLCHRQRRRQCHGNRGVELSNANDQSTPTTQQRIAGQ